MTLSWTTSAAGVREENNIFDLAKLVKNRYKAKQKNLDSKTGGELYKSEFSLMIRVCITVCICAFVPG